MPQSEQFLGSREVSTQTGFPLQSVAFASHLQVPLEQVPRPQAWPHSPQLSGSFKGSMQVPLQARKFGLQTQVPPRQNSPTPQLCPQLPQFVPSFRS